jgi:tape measure domain-containing protein
MGDMDLLGADLREVLRGAANAFTDAVRREMNAAVRSVNVRDLGTTIRGAIGPGRDPSIAGMLPPGGGRRGGGGDLVSYQPPPRERGGAIVPYAPRSELGAGYFGGTRFAAQMEGADRYLRQARVPLAGAISELSSEFANATKQVLLYGTAYQGLAFLTQLPSQALAAAASLQTFRNQLNAVTGSASNADKSFAFVDSLAARFAVPLDSAREGFVKLYASMSPAGFNASEIEGLFEGISKAAATFGMSKDKVDRVSYAFAQMASKGQVMAEELRGQLGDVLPGSLALFAKAANMSIPEFSKAMEDGAFKGAAMQQLLRNVATLLNTDFAAGAKGAAETLQGSLNAMGNSLMKLYESFEPLVAMVARNVFPVLTQAMSDAGAAVRGLSSSFANGGTATTAMNANARALYDVMRQLMEMAKAVGATFTGLAPSLLNVGRSVLFVLEQVARLVNTPIGQFFTQFILQTTLAMAAVQALTKVGLLPAIAALVRWVAVQWTAAASQATVIARLGAMTQALTATATAARLARFALTGLVAGTILLGLEKLVFGMENAARASEQLRKNSMDATMAIRTMMATEVMQQQRQAERELQDVQRIRGARGVLVPTGPYSKDTEDLVSITEQQAKALESYGIEVRRLMGMMPAVRRMDLGAAEQNIKRRLAEATYRKETADFVPPTPVLPSIPQVAGEGDAAKAADKARSDQERLINQQQQSLLDAAALQSRINEIDLDKKLAINEALFEKEKSNIEKLYEIRSAFANRYQRDALQLNQQLLNSELRARKAVADAIANISKAGLAQQNAQVKAQAARQADALSPEAAAAAPFMRAFGGGAIGNMLPGTRGGPNFNQGLGAGRGHQGQDLGIDPGDPIHARRAGTVTQYIPSFTRPGNRFMGAGMRIRYDDGMEGTYGHIQNPVVRQGQRVEAGQKLATVFNDQLNTHLHYELRNALGKLLDPNAAIRASLKVPPGAMSPAPASGPAFSVQRREQQADYGAQEAAATLQATTEAELAKLDAAMVAERNQLEVDIARSRATALPLEDLMLENTLLKERNDLQRAGASDTYINYQEKLGEATWRGASQMVTLRDALQRTVKDLAQYTRLTKAYPQFAGVYSKAIAEQEERIELLRVQMQQATLEQIDYERELARGAKAAMLHEEAMRQMQEALQTVESAVRGVMDGYKGFVLDVLKGGDIRDAAQRLQQQLAEQTFTMVIDYAMKPVEQFFKGELLKLFGLPDEEEQRKALITKIEEQIQKTGEQITATKDLTAVMQSKTTPSTPPSLSEAAGPMALPVVPFGQEAPQALAGAMESADTSLAASSESIAASLGSGVQSFSSFSGAMAYASNEAAKQVPLWQQNLGLAVQSIGGAVASITSIVGGISQIKKGGISNVLGGIGSIFLGAGSALGSFAGISKGLSMGAGAMPMGNFTNVFKQPFTVKGFSSFANGGMVNGPTLGLVGEGRYNEAIVPLPDGRSIPVQFNNSQPSLREAMANPFGSPSSPVLSMSFETTNIGGVEYVSRDQLEAAMLATRRQATRDGAARGMNMTLDKLQQSPSTRSRVGLRG